MTDYFETENTTLVHVIQGDYVISNQQKDVLTTVLGSCVSACIYDPINRIGGMNHFLLDVAPKSEKENLKYGLHAMELLINNLLKHGAQRKNLHARAFGGAQMTNDRGRIGKNNARFTVEYFQREDIPLVAQCLGGRKARRIRFWPVSGKMQRKFVSVAEPMSPVHKSFANNGISRSAGKVEIF